MLLTSFSENIYKKIFYRFLMKTLDFQRVYFPQISYEKLWFFSAQQRPHHLTQQHWSSFEAVKDKSELDWRPY